MAILYTKVGEDEETQPATLWDCLQQARLMVHAMEEMVPEDLRLPVAGGTVYFHYHEDGSLKDIYLKPPLKPEKE